MTRGAKRLDAALVVDHDDADTDEHRDPYRFARLKCNPRADGKYVTLRKRRDDDSFVVAACVPDRLDPKKDFALVHLFLEADEAFAIARAIDAYYRRVSVLEKRGGR